ncbi:MAG: phosphoglycolate phosphatase [Methylophilaceae bacterium]|jgi:phosphoglycolate phosphatase|nr:phosphoglycolate phosphatase [Methylophilaceae bacterium]
MIRLVMYDLDGTLLDTAGEIAAAVNLALAEFGGTAVDEARVRTWIGHGAARLIEEAWRASATPETLAPIAPLEEVRAGFMRHYRNTVATSSRPYPHVLETLRRVRALGVKQAIITNKDAHFTARVLQQHGMSGLFDLVVSGDSLPVRKPDPGVVRHCLQTLQETPQHSLYVGDSDIDVATARGAGVTCWLVPYGYNGGRDVAQSGADRLIDDLRAVYVHLQDNIECEV